MGLLFDQHYFLFIFFDLSPETFDSFVSRRFEGIVLVFGEKLLAWHIQLDFDYFVFVSFVFIDPHKNLPVNDSVIEGVQFVCFSLNKVDQFAIRIKMDGVHLQFHNPLHLSG